MINVTPSPSPSSSKDFVLNVSNSPSWLPTWPYTFSVKLEKKLNWYSLKHFLMRLMVYKRFYAKFGISLLYLLINQIEIYAWSLLKLVFIIYIWYHQIESPWTKICPFFLGKSKITHEQTTSSCRLEICYTAPVCKHETLGSIINPLDLMYNTPRTQSVYF